MYHKFWNSVVPLSSASLRMYGEGIRAEIETCDNDTSCLIIIELACELHDGIIIVKLFSSSPISLEFGLYIGIKS